ncbi:hypothetical protein ACLOJK_022723, partial [Asimina triloba]
GQSSKSKGSQRQERLKRLREGSASFHMGRRSTEYGAPPSPSSAAMDGLSGEPPIGRSEPGEATVRVCLLQIRRAPPTSTAITPSERWLFHPL